MTKDISQENRKIVDMYRDAFRIHGDKPASVLWPRGRQEMRFHALTRHFKDEHFSILDYGCGLGHLNTYLDSRFHHYDYIGVDIVPEFVEAVSHKFPNAVVKLIDSEQELLLTVDHVVISGTFNINNCPSRDLYLKKIFEALVYLFGLAKVSLSVNFMTDRVDFCQPNAFHMNLEELTNFCFTKLSNRLTIDFSYMPYEFTLVIFKDTFIKRPENTFRLI